MLVHHNLLNIILITHFLETNHSNKVFGLLIEKVLRRLNVGKRERGSVYLEIVICDRGGNNYFDHRGKRGCRIKRSWRFRFFEL